MPQRYDDLVKHLLLANSPYYVVDKFAMESFVKSLAEKSSASLRRSLRLLASKNSDDRNVIAYSYALAVALFLKKDYNSLQSVVDLFPHDVWFERIVVFLQSKIEKRRFSVSFTKASIPISLSPSHENGSHHVQLSEVKV